MKFLTPNDFIAGMRLARKLPHNLRHPLSYEEAFGTLQQRLRHRSSSFLTLVRKAIYENPGSPYLKLLKHAGCEFGDLQNLVAKDGIEGALLILFHNGVYLTNSEFKGRQPAKRGSFSVEAGPSLLRNPLMAHHIKVYTSGSRGESIPVLMDLDFIRERTVNHLLALHSREASNWKHSVWGVPGSTDLVRILELSLLGFPPESWFSQVDFSSSSLHPRYRWSGRVMRWIGKLSGVTLPAPQYVPPDNPLPIVEWMDGVIKEGHVAHVVTYVSAALRICRAAEQEGKELTGVQYSVGGEPLTEARLATIRRSGAMAIPRFMALECGYIGYGCLLPDSADDFHVFHDLHAVIQAGQNYGEENLPSSALLISSLCLKAPIIMLNVSLGDQADFERRTCGCALEKLGWTSHISKVRSFEKLTSGGMTFMDTDVIKIVEEVLPSRFGGSPIDYQLLEDEEKDGSPRLRILVNPSVGPLDPQEIIKVFLEAIGSRTEAECVMSLQWKGADFLTVERQPPKLTHSGKIAHFLKLRN